MRALTYLTIDFVRSVLVFCPLIFTDPSPLQGKYGESMVHYSRVSMWEVSCITAGSVCGKYGASQQGQYGESMLHHTGYQQVSVRAFRFGRYLL